jgi:hypothetical protein
MTFGLGRLTRPSPPALLPPTDRERLFAFAASLSRARLEVSTDGQAVLSAGGRTLLFRRTGAGTTISSSCGWRFRGDSMEAAIDDVRRALDTAAAPVILQVAQGDAVSGAAQRGAS